MLLLLFSLLICDQSIYPYQFIRKRRGFFHKLIPYDNQINDNDWDRFYLQITSLMFFPPTTGKHFLTKPIKNGSDS